MFNPARFARSDSPAIAGLPVNINVRHIGRSSVSSVFLSHSHADKPFVHRLATALRNFGHRVWIDEAEIKIGDSLIQKIRDGLDSVDYVAAILSSNSIKSEWVTKELEIACNREINERRVVVLPLMVEKVDMPGFLMGKLYSDFTEENRYSETLERLLRTLGPVHYRVILGFCDLGKTKFNRLSMIIKAESKLSATQKAKEKFREMNPAYGNKEIEIISVDPCANS